MLCSVVYVALKILVELISMMECLNLVHVNFLILIVDVQADN